MTSESWLIYLTLVIAACASPGPAVLFAVTTAMNYGWKKALFAATGNIFGLLCLAIVAITGLGTLLDVSVTLYNVVKYVGAAYLVYMGTRLILNKHSASILADRERSGKDTTAQKVFFQAMTIAISNPKAIVFLTALLPQFVDVERALLPQFTQLMSLFMFFSFLFLMAYALLAYRIKDWLRKPNSGNLFNGVSGFIFISFGLLLAVSSKE